MALIVMRVTVWFVIEEHFGISIGSNFKFGTIHKPGQVHRN